MPDPYYDSLVAEALEVDGVWLAGNQGNYGIHLDSERPLDVAVPEIAQRLTTAKPWRVSDIAYRPDEATLTVISEIDRSINVIVGRRTPAAVQ